MSTAIPMATSTGNVPSSASSQSDISARNFLLKVADGEILNNWDQIVRRMDKNPTTRHPYRLGTWQFMSSTLLLQPGKVNTVRDDMESFLWLVLYHVLRYTKHNRLPEVKKVMEYIFDEEDQATSDTSVRGGHVKRRVFFSRDYLGFDFSVKGNESLDNLIYELLDHWSEWYQSLHDRDLKVSKAVCFQQISRKAAERYPFDPRNLAMFNHDAMLQVFEATLEMKTWPIEDVALDSIPKKPAEKLEVIVDHVEYESPPNSNIEEY